MTSCIPVSSSGRTLIHVASKSLLIRVHHFEIAQNKTANHYTVLHPKIVELRDSPDFQFVTQVHTFENPFATDFENPFATDISNSMGRLQFGASALNFK